MPGRLEAVRLGQLRLAAEEDLLQARLDCGDHAGVAADGTVLTGQQPFRERRWALLALAQYRGGRQADALGSIRSARRALGQELGLDPGSELVALGVPHPGPGPRPRDRPRGTGGRRDLPMEGTRAVRRPRRRHLLRAGRRHRGLPGPARGVAAARRHRPVGVRQVLACAGRAGPGLRGSGAEVEVFTPGADGAMAMAAARSRRPGDPVLVIDQFEETFTLRGATFARPWLGDLARYAEESAAVVLVVRGDHVAELGADAELARLAERGLHLVTPLAGDRLREAVEGPARGRRAPAGAGPGRPGRP